MSMIGNVLRLSTKKVEALRAHPERITKVLYPSEGDTAMSDDVLLDLDKAWHGIHFMLTGSVWEGDPLLGFLVLGDDIGDVDVGYGPARGFDEAQVRAVADVLRPITTDVLRGRFDPSAQGWGDVYPMNHQSPSAETRDYFLEYYERLREFVIATAELGAGLIVYIN